jgi:hypothetical protein
MLDELRWNKLLAAPSPERARPHGRHALADAHLDLLPGADFELVTGQCAHCPVPEAALWYFRDEVIAVPRAGLPISGRLPSDARPDEPA